MELIKDYDCMIDYHLGKTNANASSVECSFFVDIRWYCSDRIDRGTEFVESSARGIKER